MKSLNTKNKAPLVIMVCAAVIVLAVGSYFVLAYTTKQFWPFVAANSSNTTSLDTSSDSDTEDTDSSLDAKERSTEQDKQNSNSDNTSTSPDGLKVVEIGVTYAGIYGQNVEVRAFASGVIEGNGKCKAIFTQGPQTVTRSSDAFIDATTTQCGVINIPLSEFPTKGTWKLTVTYASPTSTGSYVAGDIAL
ncbi:MAG: hypothetical protein V4611_02005 [Patescibacteria group bacterium]